MVQRAKSLADEDERGASTLRIVTAVLLGAVVLIGWLPRLRWGLKLDETFSAWQAEGGWAVARTKLGNPGQSILFGYLEALFYFPRSPHMELWLRLPALAGAILSVFFVHRLAESFVGRGAGFTAVVVFVANPYVVDLSCEARPYTLATAACLASLWSLRRWLDGGRRRDAVLFAVSLALVAHLHLLYLTFAVVPALLIVVHVARGRRVSWRGLAGALALTALLVAPLVPFLRDFARHRDGLSYLAPPSWDRLGDVLTPGMVLLSLVGFVPLWLISKRRSVRIPVAAGDDTRSTLVLMAGWLFVPPLVLFVVSRAVGQTILVERYLLYTAAAQGLVVAALYRRAAASLARVAALLCLLPVPIVLAAQDWTRDDGFASVRAPLRAARALDPAGVAPLFLCSGHPLSNAVDWRRALDEKSFLYSQLAAYPVPNPVYPLPFTLDESAERFVRDAAAGPVGRSPLVLVVGEPARETMTWMKELFEARGYRASFAVRAGFGLLVLQRSPGAAQ